MPAAPREKREWYRRALFLAAGVGLVAYGCLGFIQYRMAVSNAHPIPNPARIVTDSQATPDETPIDPNAEYRVLPTLPRRIMFSSLTEQGLIQQVGVTDDGAMAVPSNVHVAGWYANSALPGSEGLSIIDGHVMGRYQAGIFERLGRLASGDRFQIEMGDLTRKTFQVVSVATYSASEAQEKLFQKDLSIKNQLTLVTCAGQYDKKAQQYDQRVLVVSKLVPS